MSKNAAHNIASAKTPIHRHSPHTLSSTYYVGKCHWYTVRSVFEYKCEIENRMRMRVSTFLSIWDVLIKLRSRKPNTEIYKPNISIYIYVYIYKQNMFLTVIISNE